MRPSGLGVRRLGPLLQQTRDFAHSRSDRVRLGPAALRDQIYKILQVQGLDLTRAADVGLQCVTVPKSLPRLRVMACCKANQVLAVAKSSEAMVDVEAWLIPYQIARFVDGRGLCRLAALLILRYATE